MRERNNRVIPLGVFLGILGVIVFPQLSAIFFRESSKGLSNKSVCHDYFNNETHTDGRTINTVLLGELHGVNEQHVTDCLESLVTEGDHLLIEALDEGKEIKCNTVHPAYQRFNGKLKCYGFDVPIDEARRRYNDLAYRANFLYKNADIFLQKAKTPKDVVKDFKSFGDKIIHTKSSLPTDSDFIKRQGKYFIKLSKKLQGLSFPEIGDFLIQENRRLTDRADYYEKLSRRGPTNDALVKQITEHQEKLVGSKQRLFAVAGTNHLDPALNAQLIEVIKGKEPVTILRPKSPGSSP